MATLPRAVGGRDRRREQWRNRPDEPRGGTGRRRDHRDGQFRRPQGRHSAAFSARGSPPFAWIPSGVCWFARIRLLEHFGHGTMLPLDASGVEISALAPRMASAAVGDLLRLGV